jgi:tetratricopeptide (TPR) repeat protein
LLSGPGTGLAAGYLAKVMVLKGPFQSEDNPVLLRRAIIQGRLDLAEGKREKALELFESFLNRHGKNAVTTSAGSGKAEVQLVEGDADAAVAAARIALELAKFLEGTTQYSNNTGLAALMSGRALEADGKHAQAQETLQAAVTNLSNTVDADHPELLQARRLLGASG